MSSKELSATGTDFDLDPTDELARARMALDAGRMGSWTWDVETDIIHGDQFTADLFGFPANQKQWPRAAILKHFHPDDVPMVQKVIADVVSHEDTYKIEFRRITPNSDKVQWIHNRAQVMSRSETGRAIRLVGVCWDVTEKAKQKEKLLQIAGEMDHRAKNAFAVIRAMINIGKRTSKDIVSFADTLRGQVEAIASGHDLAARVSRDTQISQAPVPIVELIEASLKPWILAQPEGPSRIAITGDPVLTLDPNVVAALSMLLCEMAANSIKSGSLGSADGQLSVSVRPTAAGLDLIWDETFVGPLGGADAKVEEFSTILISHCVATLNGTMDRMARTTGHCTKVSLPI